MKVYISSLIPKLARFSKKLDDTALLVNKHWVVIDEVHSIKTIYIFRKNNELLISTNGKVKKAKWDYIGNNSILIDIGEDSYLFKHGFFDENVLALKIESSDEYAFLVNEQSYEKANTISKLHAYLSKKYLDTNLVPAPIEQPKPITKVTAPIQTLPTKPLVKTIDPEKLKHRQQSEYYWSMVYGVFMLLIFAGLAIPSLYVSTFTYQHEDKFIFWLSFLFGAAMSALFVGMIPNFLRLRKEYFASKRR